MGEVVGGVDIQGLLPKYTHIATINVWASSSTGPLRKTISSLSSEGSPSRALYPQ